MKVIYKYAISKGEIQVLKCSKILCVQLQNNKPHVWILVDTEEKEFETRQFRIVGTGEHFDDKDMKYICTYQHDIFVWHVFEKTERI